MAAPPTSLQAQFRPTPDWPKLESSSRQGVPVDVANGEWRMANGGQSLGDL